MFIHNHVRPSPERYLGEFHGLLHLAMPTANGSTSCQCWDCREGWTMVRALSCAQMGKASEGKC